MKSLIATFSLILVLTSVCTLKAQTKKPLYTITKDKIEVEFTTSYTLKDVQQVKEDLKKEKIDLSYSLLEFDENGFLQRISASIAYPDGQKGGFESRILQPGDKPGFRRKL